MPFTFRNDIVNQGLCYPTDNFMGRSHEAGSALCRIPLSLKEIVFKMSSVQMDLKLFVKNLAVDNPAPPSGGFSVGVAEICEILSRCILSPILSLVLPWASLVSILKMECGAVAFLRLYNIQKYG